MSISVLPSHFNTISKEGETLSNNSKLAETKTYLTWSRMEKFQSTPPAAAPNAQRSGPALDVTFPRWRFRDPAASRRGSAPWRGDRAVWWTDETTKEMRTSKPCPDNIRRWGPCAESASPKDPTPDSRLGKPMPALIYLINLHIQSYKRNIYHLNIFNSDFFCIGLDNWS